MSERILTKSLVDVYVEHHPTLPAMEFVRRSYPFESDLDLHRFAGFVIHMRSEFSFDDTDTQIFCERSICRLIRKVDFDELIERVDAYIEECTHA